MVSTRSAYSAQHIRSSPWSFSIEVKYSQYHISVVMMMMMLSSPTVITTINDTNGLLLHVLFCNRMIGLGPTIL